MLNDPHILRTKEEHEAWHLALEEPGYPVDTFKRYDYFERTDDASLSSSPHQQHGAALPKNPLGNTAFIEEQWEA